MEVVNKKVLADKVAEENGITKKLASEVIDTLFATMTEALKDGKKVDITGFGKFEVKQRAARTGINPQTKEQIQIAATTRAGDLSSPLRDRFGIISKLEYYNEAQLSAIIARSSRVLGVSIDEDAIIEIAKRSRGTPRIANRLLRRIRDFAQVLNNGVISKAIVDDALVRLHVDSLGLDEVDIRYLRGIIERFQGGPVGLEALANSISEETTTLEDVYEPYLIQIGFVNRTSRGRVVTEKAYEHLGIHHPETLF